MNRTTADVLAECMGAIERGEMTREECLSRYPEREQELAPLLKTFEALRQAQAVSPRPAYRHAARSRLLSRLSDRRPLTWRDRLIYSWGALMGRTQVRRSAIALGLMMVVFLALIGGRGAVYASQEALPGDSLYVVKTGVEEFRLAFSPKEDAVRLYLGFTGTRVQEVERLAGVGRYEDVPAAMDRYHTQVQRASDLLSQIARQDAMRGETLGALWDEEESAYRSDLERVLQTLPEQMRLQLERGDGEELQEVDGPNDGASGSEDDDWDEHDQHSEDKASSADGQGDPPSLDEAASEDKGQDEDTSHESAESSSSDEESSDHYEGDEAGTDGHADADLKRGEEGSSADNEVKDDPDHDDDPTLSDDAKEGAAPSDEGGSDGGAQPTSEPDDHGTDDERHDGSDDDDKGQDTAKPESDSGGSYEGTDGAPGGDGDTGTSDDDDKPDSGDGSSHDKGDDHKDDDGGSAEGGDGDHSTDEDASSYEHGGDDEPKDRSDD
jgi:hypothetical protein